MSNEQRDKFEAWARSSFRRLSLFTTSFGSYYQADTQASWEAWQAALAQPEPVPLAIDAAAWVEARRDTYIEEHGSYDPATGVMWFPGEGAEYVQELEEIAEGIRALTDSGQPEPEQADIAELVEALEDSFCRHCMDTGLIPVRDGVNGQTAPCEWCRAKKALLTKHCTHSSYSFAKHGRGCPCCGTLMADFGD